MDRKDPSEPDTNPPPRGDGVDVSLIQWMLSLTPLERLQVLQQAVNSINKLRDAKRNP